MTTTKAVAKVEPTNQELAELQAVISQGGTELNPAQVKITWLYAAKRGLDVISRQLIPTVIRGKLTFITTIDGFRVIAERSGDYAGQDPIKYQTNESGSKLEWAEATVYRHSWGDRGLTVRAYWDEFVPDGKGDYMWKKMPHVMLGKVAEAQALRKAFPNDMSGMYSDDEMAQAGVEAKAQDVQVEAKPPEPEAVHHQEETEAAHEADPVAEGMAEDFERAAEEQPPEQAQEKARPKYPRRRGAMSDAQWAQRLRAAPAISDSQRQWLEDWDEANPEPEAAGEVVEEGDLVAQAKEVFADELPDADVDPSRGGSSEPEAQPMDDLPEPEPEPEPAPLAEEMLVVQGADGEAYTAECIYLSGEVMTTKRGNEVLVCWVTPDKETRVECVMAASLADEGGALQLGQGQPVEVKGTWNNVGGRLVVLATSIRAA